LKTKGLTQSPSTAKDSQAKFGGAAGAARKDRRRQRAHSDHAAIRRVKIETTFGCPETTENQEERQDFAQLVVKYFGDEIREALAEISVSIHSTKFKTRTSAAGRRHTP
jgi:hypothetical protein